MSRDELEALNEICHRIERDRNGDGDETYREQALRRGRLVDMVYVMIENLIAAAGTERTDPQ
jgi:hypothetical protein